MKRSTQVVLLLMGVAGIGASAYSFSTAKRDCVPRGTRETTSPIDGKDGRLPPCPPGHTYAPNQTGYYRSTWRRAEPSHWSTPIFARRSGTSKSAQPSSTSLGFTWSGTTSRSTAPTTRTGFGSIGRSFSISS